MISISATEPSGKRMVSTSRSMMRPLCSRRVARRAFEDGMVGGWDGGAPLPSAFDEKTVAVVKLDRADVERREWCGHQRRIADDDQPQPLRVDVPLRRLEHVLGGHGPDVAAIAVEVVLVESVDRHDG